MKSEGVLPRKNGGDDWAAQGLREGRAWLA